MNCTNHPDKEAVGMCTYCGKPFCSDCLVEVKGKMYCKADLGNVLDDAKSTASAAAPQINITNTANATNANNVGTFGAESPKSKTVALLLCLLGFIGIAGIHRFYIGKPISGFLYLITLGWFGIGTIADLLMLLAGTFKDGAGYPLRR